MLIFALTEVLHAPDPIPGWLSTPKWLWHLILLTHYQHTATCTTMSMFYGIRSASHTRKHAAALLTILQSETLRPQTKTISIDRVVVLLYVPLETK